MSKDLIERLRGFKQTPKHAENLCHEAADLIERQAAHIEMMREVLEFMWRDVPMNDYAFEKCEKALSTTPDQALEQFAAKVRDQCFYALDPDKYPNECDKSMVYNCKLAIRAITELPK